MRRLFIVDVDSGRESSRMTLIGVLDADGVSALREAYEGAASRRGPQHVLIDIADLQSCDADGERALRRCHAAGALVVGAPISVVWPYAMGSPGLEPGTSCV